MKEIAMDFTDKQYNFLKHVERILDLPVEKIIPESLMIELIPKNEKFFIKINSFVQISNGCALVLDFNFVKKPEKEDLVDNNSPVFFSDSQEDDILSSDGNSDFTTVDKIFENMLCFDKVYKDNIFSINSEIQMSAINRLANEKKFYIYDYCGITSFGAIYVKGLEEGQIFQGKIGLKDLMK